MQLKVECLLSELKMINCSDKSNRCLTYLSFWGIVTNYLHGKKIMKRLAFIVISCASSLLNIAKF